ncbi:MAG: VOC family protein [Gemmatimonadetes bacterium]|nr:VOC family protein [Gemmatimonadota bacterium]
MQQHILPDHSHIGRVDLQVGNLAASLDFYTRILGFREHARDGQVVTLTAQGSDSALVVLHERPGAPHVPVRGRLGLFHFAILLPDRPSLARFFAHLSALHVEVGAGDHLVSEAFYLQDPDGLGIEVYADRPRDQWTRTANGVEMATLPVNIADLLPAAGNIPWSGMPAGTVIGHMHLHVGDLAAARQFYGAEIGFSEMAALPGASFLAAGGYHHHLGVNTWARGAESAHDDEAHLLEWTLCVPSDGFDAVRDRLNAAGRALDEAGASFLVRDPWGTAVRVRAE